MNDMLSVARHYVHLLLPTTLILNVRHCDVVNVLVLFLTCSKVTPSRPIGYHGDARGDSSCGGGGQRQRSSARAKP